jgi:hypothetical protein
LRAFSPHRAFSSNTLFPSFFAIVLAIGYRRAKASNLQSLIHGSD